jgi:hypothetical protein
MDTTTWICPNKPFAHDWNGGLSCGCGATRTAADAITSLLAGWEGWDQSRAAALVEQHRLQALREDGTSRARLQEQLDRVKAELAAIKEELADLTATTAGPR